MLRLTTKTRARLADQKADFAIQLANTALAASLAGTRSRRKPDLSRPITINPESLELFKVRAIREGLQKLLANETFYISDFDNLTELAGLFVDGDLRRSLRVWHCVKWGDMDQETCEQVQAQVLSVFVIDEPQEESEADHE